MLRRARRRAGLSQRQLAAAVGVPQSEVGRIESGATVPRVDTLDRILAGCGEQLASRPRLGVGIDRSAIRQMLELSPAERAHLAIQEARNLELIGPRGRRVRRS